LACPPDFKERKLLAVFVLIALVLVTFILVALVVLLIALVLIVLVTLVLVVLTVLHEDTSFQCWVQDLVWLKTQKLFIKNKEIHVDKRKMYWYTN